MGHVSMGMSGLGWGWEEAVEMEEDDLGWVGVSPSHLLMFPTRVELYYVLEMRVVCPS